jgi:hypothetical protein
MKRDFLTGIDVDAVLFDPSPMWLALFDAPDSPAIHLTPLDWTQYEFARRISCVLGTDVVNPRVLLRQLVKLATPDAWRGFIRNGKAIPFDADLLVQVLCSNVEIGAAFDQRLKARAEQGKQAEDAARKNSGAGRATPSSEPGSETTTAS